MVRPSRTVVGRPTRATVDPGDHPRRHDRRRPDASDLLVREPRVRHRRDRDARHLGRDRARDVRPAHATTGPAGQAPALPRGLDARHARTDRRPRRPAAVRLLPAPRARRRHAAVRDELPARCSPGSGSSPAGSRRSSASASTPAGGSAPRHGASCTASRSSSTCSRSSTWSAPARTAPARGCSAMLTALTAPIVFAFTYRVLPGAPRRTPRPARVQRLETDAPRPAPAS